MKRLQARFADDGTLILPDWSFSNPYVRVPHRSYDLATCTIGKQTFRVRRNHPGTLYWVDCVGDGFAGGGCSRNSHTVTTRSADTAHQWAEAVRQGKVKVEA